MEAISGIGGGPAGGWPQIYGTSGLGPASGQAGVGPAAEASVTASQSAQSISSTRMTAQIESFMATYGPVMSNNDLLGAVLLMLVMEYLKTDDKSDKEDLLAVITALAQQQQQAGAGGVFMYNSISLGFETTQTQMMSTELAVSAYSSAYNGAAATLQQAPGVDAGAAGLNVMA